MRYRISEDSFGLYVRIGIVILVIHKPLVGLTGEITKVKSHLEEEFLYFL